jgi:hypothetical protein
MANVNIELGYKTLIWFNANPTLVLLAGQIVYLGQTGTYKIGDGVSTLSALNFLGISSETQTLQNVTDLGNTTTNDIQFDAGVGVLLDNTSRLREGTIDAGYGGNKGISQICAVGYELKWESGSLYVMDGNGTHIRHTLYNFSSVPSITEDINKGFLVGTRWSLDNGNVYVCTDNSIGAAVWALEASDFTDAEKTKLSGIASGAEVNVNADWNATSGDAEILNKPTIPSAITKTSELINDGDDGNPFISLNDLPSNLILYATTAASDIPTYVKLVSSITDIDYNTTAVDVSTGSITTTNQFISALITSPNVIVGNPGVLNITTIGNIRRTSGTGNAEFYFEVYKRTIGGVETLITTSGNTIPVINTGYAEFSATALWNDGIFLATDRIVLKFYGTRIVGGSNPTYDFQFGGSTPVRSLVPIPLTVSPVLTLDNLQDVTIASVANNEILTYESSTSLWKNKSVTTALGFTPANQDNTILYHTLKFFTPTSTVSTSGTTVTITTSQFSASYIGMKLIILGEGKIITAYISATQVTVASAYSINYSGIAIADWGVYNKMLNIDNGNPAFYYYNSLTAVKITNDNGISTANVQGSNFGVYAGESVFSSNYVFRISSTTSQFGTKDLGFRRNSAGVFEIFDGITTTGLLANRRDLLVRNINASKITFLAGTTTVAPLTLTAGTNLTTPVNGSFEFDGTNLYFTVGGVRKTVTLI